MPQKKEALHKINEFIKSPLIRIVGENIESKIVKVEEGLSIAYESGLDLVEISPNSNPPVCKVIDYKKFLYDQKRKEKENKQNSSKVIIKEIRLSPHTDEHDFNFKVNNSIKFLKDKNKVKVYVFFKGRMISYKEQGELILLKFATSLSEYGKVESLPKLEGKKMIMIVSPKK
jgi:translation initiation factor IF-3